MLFFGVELNVFSKPFCFAMTSSLCMNFLIVIIHCQIHHLQNNNLNHLLVLKFSHISGDLLLYDNLIILVMPLNFDLRVATL